MLGMNFTSFLTLLVISVVVASVYHWILRYHFLEGIDSFLAKVALGWIGGWLGSPVLGQLAVESPECLHSTGDPRCYCSYAPQRALLESVCQASGHRTRRRRGDTTQACSMNSAAVYAGRREQKATSTITLRFLRCPAGCR